MPPKGGGGNAALEGAFAAGLVRAPRLAIMATPPVMARFTRLSDTVASWVRRGFMDVDFYMRVVSNDPILSLQRQMHREGVVAWANHIYRSGDTTIPVAAASSVLGVEPESRKPVLKAEAGVDGALIDEILAQPEFVSTDDDDDREYKPPKTMQDGITLDPDALVSKQMRRQTNNDRGDGEARAQRRARELLHEVEVTVEAPKSPLVKPRVQKARVTWSV